MTGGAVRGTTTIVRCAPAPGLRDWSRERRLAAARPRDRQRRADDGAVLVEPARDRAAAPPPRRFTWRAVVTGGAVALLATLGVVGVANALGDNLFPSLGPTSPASVWQNPVPATEPEPDDVATTTVPTTTAPPTTSPVPTTAPATPTAPATTTAVAPGAVAPAPTTSDPRRDDDDDDDVAVTTVPAPSDDEDPTIRRRRELERLGVVGELGLGQLGLGQRRLQRRRLSVSRLELQSARCSRAHRAAWVRSVTPRRWNTLVRCAFTVRSEIPSRRAICLLARPSVTRSSTSRSRSVSCGPAARVRRDSSSVRAAFGSRGDPPSCTARIALAMSSGSLCLSR